MQDVWSESTAVRLACVIGLLSVLDLALTLTGIRMGVITEGNPMMNAVLQASPQSFILVKTLLTLLFVCVVSRYAGRFDWAGPAVVSVLAVYVGVMGLHARWILVAMGIY